MYLYYIRANPNINNNLTSEETFTNCPSFHENYRLLLIERITLIVCFGRGHTSKSHENELFI